MSNQTHLNASTPHDPNQISAQSKATLCGLLDAAKRDINNDSLHTALHLLRMVAGFIDPERDRITKLEIAADDAGVVDVHKLQGAE